MSDLYRALQWRLLNGSHEFPGPDGGTCINEAALVVAGFSYRKVGGIDDMPQCFSRPISAYALRINDSMPDDLRQELLTPFVVRLAGTADTPEIECKRADLIAVRTVSTVLPIMLRLRRLEDLAQLCESVSTRQEGHAAAKRARDHLHDDAADAAATYAATYAAYAYAADAAADYAATYAAAAAAAYYAYAAATYAADAADYAADYAADAAADYAADAAYYAADYAYADVRRAIWTAAASILDAALKIGRQAEPIETAVILARAEKAKRREFVYSEG